MKPLKWMIIIGITLMYSHGYSQTLEEKIGQMILVGFRGTEVTDGSLIKHDIQRYKIGGVVLYETDNSSSTKVRNIVSKEQVLKLTTQLQDLSSTPLFIAIDQEGGKVQRLDHKYGFNNHKSHLELGKKNNLIETQKTGKAIGDELKRVGINLNFAPSVDLIVNNQSLIVAKLYRSFSDDPQVVYEHAKAYMAGLHDAGVFSSLKHFPGFGSETGKKHNGFFDISNSWSENELLPYEKLIADSEVKVDAIMVSHVFLNKFDSEYPASLSKKTIQSILRDKLGFDGLIIGESPQTKFVIENYGLEEGIRLQVLAGVDMLQFANNLIYDEDIVPKTIEIISKMVSNNEISKERIHDSYKRIMKLKATLDPN